MSFLDSWSQHWCLGTIAFCASIALVAGLINMVGTVLIRRNERKSRIVAKERERCARACERLGEIMDPGERRAPALVMREAAHFIRSGENG